ncbi:hypothetical protein JCM10908_002190 [Rhodotorula pacifica]|uniref:uncharacterized protein n=1 Tax=Rhodotorula pacifica TaxID=1495444 RepID=UPI003171F579
MLPPHMDRPSLRRPLTAPAPIRPHAAAPLSPFATHPVSVLKPHPLRASHVLPRKTAMEVDMSAEEVKHPEKEQEKGREKEEEDQEAEEELRELVAKLSLRRPLFSTEENTNTHTDPDVSVAVRPPSTSTATSSSYLSRAPRTPSRGGGARSRNGHGHGHGFGHNGSIRRKNSLVVGGGGVQQSRSEQEQTPMQVDSAPEQVEKQRETPPLLIIGVDGKKYSPPSRAMTRNPFLRQTPSSRPASFLHHQQQQYPQIVRSATEPVRPPT